MHLTGRYDTYAEGCQMGLDVYVGSLIRYYTGNWETIVQQLGRDMLAETKDWYSTMQSHDFEIQV